MRLSWEIEPQDVEHVQALVKSQGDNTFVQEREMRNLWEEPPIISKELFWKELVTCLLTSQQRSGPDSQVNRFIRREPFPFSLQSVRNASQSSEFVADTLVRWGGIRFVNRVGEQVARNLMVVDSQQWVEIEDAISTVCAARTPEVEIEAAEAMESMFAGIGPKQARNLLQGLGLTLYEIPIDSRIVKWLNQAGFPVKLSARALADRNYYSFISRGIRKLCAAADVYPCVFDALVFSSYDGDGWTTDNVVH